MISASFWRHHNHLFSRYRLANLPAYLYGEGDPVETAYTIKDRIKNELGSTN